MKIKMMSAMVSAETFIIGGGFMVDIIVNKEKTPNVYEAWLYHERYGIKELMFGWCSGTYKEFVDMVKGNLENEDYIFDYYNEHMAEDAVFEMFAETKGEQK